MALVATVSKTQVIEKQKNLWNVVVNMSLADDSVVVINKDYSVEYIPGDSIGSKQATLYAMMEADKAKYVSEQNIFDAAALDTVVANIEAALNG
jgi:hypothetical protein